MSFENKFREVLSGHPPLVGLVADRIAENALEKETYPAIVFSVAKDKQEALCGGGIEHATFTVECWAESAAEATAVADAVKAALEAYDATAGTESVEVVSSTSDFNSETLYDVETLTVEWHRL